VRAVRAVAQDAANDASGLLSVGACHTSEVPCCFGTFEAYNMFRTTRVWTDGDVELSRTLSASLIAFASTGNPSAPAVTWPSSASDERYVRFGDAITTEAINQARLEFMARHRPAPPARAAEPRRFPRD
jgi:para-nitrobenzyl esterase